MRGRKPCGYTLKATDRQQLEQLARDGQGRQCVARRAQVLLALDRGERIVDIVHWTGVERTSLWYLWQRYQQRGLAAIFDAPRSGRPRVFSPAAAGRDRTRGVPRTSRLRGARIPVGLSQLAAGCGRASYRRVHPLHDGGLRSGQGQFAAASQSVLEDGPAG
jgi:Winged helix-turn helix